MHSIAFIHDLATIMLTAGVVTVLFHRLHQPVVLGYLAAGVIIGPHLLPWPAIDDEASIKTLADLGVLFLMFSLGLEFSVRRLRKLGATALMAGLFEIGLMIFIGYRIGRGFGWAAMDALFLGAMVAISSTTIIVKALAELNFKKQAFAQMVAGILVVEDILAVAIIALLSGVAATGEVEAGNVFFTLGKLTVFLVTALVVGLLAVPRLLDYVARFRSHEMLLVSVLGLLFGFCLLVSNAGYSMALGAFVVGAVMAEATSLPLIERLIEPLRDMFCAIFFVAVGLLLDPHVLIEYFVPVLALTLAVVLGKTISVSLGAFVAGQDGRTSLRIGMSMAQIGEFSFIIATLGISLKVTSAFLYPIAVAVSAITALLTPYLMRAADPLSARLGSWMPLRIKRIFQLYTEWLQSLRFDGDRAVIAQIVRKSLLQVFVNCCLVVALFSGGAYLVNVRELHLAEWLPDPRAQKTLVWGAALLFSLPFLIAAYRKLKALSMLLAEMSIRSSHRHSERVRRIVSELIPALAIAAMMLLLTALSSSILPPIELLVVVLIVGALLVVLLRRRLVHWHSQLQIALMDSLQTEQDKH